MFAKLGQKIKNLFSGNEKLNKVADGSGIQLDELNISLDNKYEETVEEKNLCKETVEDTIEDTIDETVVPAEPLIDETDYDKILATHCEYYLQTLKKIFKTDNTVLKSFENAKKKDIDTPIELFRRASKLRPKNKLLKDNLDTLKIKLNVSEIIWPKNKVTKNKNKNMDSNNDSNKKENNLYNKKNVEKLKDIFKNDSKLMKSFEVARKKGIDTPEELFRRALQMRPSNKYLKELLRNN